MAKKKPTEKKTKAPAPAPAPAAAIDEPTEDELRAALAEHLAGGSSHAQAPDPGPEPEPEAAPTESDEEALASEPARRMPVAPIHRSRLPRQFAAAPRPLTPTELELYSAARGAPTDADLASESVRRDAIRRADALISTARQIVLERAQIG